MAYIKYMAYKNVYVTDKYKKSNKSCLVAIERCVDKINSRRHTRMTWWHNNTACLLIFFVIRVSILDGGAISVSFLCYV